MLHNTLKKHQQVFMSDDKEINFFTNDSYYKQGLAEYSKHFSPSGEKHLAIGESTPGYICYPNVAQRIYNDLGKIKIIMLFRDPIRRSLSQYWDNRRHFGERLSFNEATEEYLYQTYIPGQKGYFSRGKYDKYLIEYIQLFGSENIYVSVLERFLSNPLKELNKIAGFLGVNQFPLTFELSEKNNSAVIYENPLYRYFFKNPSLASYIPKRLRRLTYFGERKSFKYTIPCDVYLDNLREYYRPTIDNLEYILENNLSVWSLTKKQ